jgi:hypothetical protein
MTDALSTDTQYLVRIANAAEAATPAGTAIVGKVGIDQTTDGTTNKVSIPALTETDAIASGQLTMTGSAG